MYIMYHGLRGVSNLIGEKADIKCPYAYGRSSISNLFMGCLLLYKVDTKVIHNRKEEEEGYAIHAVLSPSIEGTRQKGNQRERKGKLQSLCQLVLLS